MIRWPIRKGDTVLYTDRLNAALYDIESPEFHAKVIKASLLNDYCEIIFEGYSESLRKTLTFEEHVHKRHLRKITPEKNPEYFI